MQNKIVLNLKVKTITPVHIGGAQEKHYIQNLDYIKEGDKIFLLDEKKLIHHFGINTYSNALASNSTASLLKSINKDDYSTQVLTLTGDPGQEIKKHINNPIDGKPIIPGSSIKGALRSVILNYLIFKNNLNPDPSKIKNIDSDVFGKISDDAMRFIQIVDTPFDKVKLLNTKIMNLQKDRDGWFGGWKKGQRETSSSFKEMGFTSGYECIDIGQESTITIVLNLAAYNLAKRNRAVKSSYALDELFNKNFEERFLGIIKTYYKFYLKSEMDYMNKYKEYDLDELAIEGYEKVLNTSNDSPVFRVGAGSGFHAMTGDWKYPNHIFPVEEHTYEGQNKRGRWEPIHLKSRKFAFEYDEDRGENGEYVFYPMGFLQILNK
jgi:hypothetical protein